MKQSIFSTIAIGAAVVGGSLVAPQQVIADETQANGEQTVQEKLIEQVEPSMVQIKFVLSIDSPYGQQEQELDTTGTMIREDGLILTSNRMLTGGQYTPTQIKVLIGDDTVGVDATLITQDKELDLAWLRIDEPAEEGYEALDMSGNIGTTRVGHRIYAVTQAPEMLGEVSLAFSAEVIGKTDTPHDVWITQASGPGLPMFNSDLELVGFMVVLTSDDAAAEGNPNARGTTMPALLPVKQVNESTAQALALEAQDNEEE